MSLPNIISLIRLMSVPIVIYLILNGLLSAAFWLFVAAGVSDAMDGFIAKRFNQETPLGRYLDPLADKALLVGVYVTLGYSDYLPLWLVILVVFRDLLIVGGVVLMNLFGQDLRMNPLRISKINTAAQIVLVTAILGERALNVSLVPEVVTILIYLTALTTVLSGAAYILGWGREAMAVAGIDQTGDGTK